MDQPPLIIDIEASGFGPYSYPIEVGLALLDGKRYCTLVEPCKEWTHWDTEAQNLHGIERDILFKAGMPIHKVAHSLNELLKGQVVYSDGWVVDKPWTTKLFNQAGIARAFRVSPLELILSEEQMAIWHHTKDQITKSQNLKRHRASIDAYIIQLTYCHTLKQTKQRIVD